jgi:NAD(P)-dependent dehydrogenase (short-subunit alcohol dehydrogenase family)
VSRPRFRSYPKPNRGRDSQKGRHERLDLELEGKVAVVTGGSKGIGKAVARELAREGVDVALVARSREALEASAAELTEETGRRVLAIPADVTDDASVREMVGRAAEAYGHLDILVNSGAPSAAFYAGLSLAAITQETVFAGINDKVMGALRCAREVAPHMQRQGWGRIINIAGMGARRAGAVVGSMRNASVVALTKNLAVELGPSGINVTVVMPGMTRTELVEAGWEEEARRLGVSFDEVLQRKAQATSVRRIIEARHIGYIVAFLASPKSIAINGDVIAAGGGDDRGIYY